MKHALALIAFASLIGCSDPPCEEYTLVSLDQASGLATYVGPDGCEQLQPIGAGAGGMTPKLDADGRPICRPWGPCPEGRTKQRAVRGNPRDAV
jgi:hypothetical protein